MRVREERYEWVQVSEETAPSLRQCRLRVHVNLPIREWELLDAANISGSVDFLAKAIGDWEGFDMLLTRENLADLSIVELRAVTQAAMEVIQNPPKPTSDGTR